MGPDSVELVLWQIAVSGNILFLLFGCQADLDFEKETYYVNSKRKPLKVKIIELRIKPEMNKKIYQ